jgi:hypothetical protein
MPLGGTPLSTCANNLSPISQILIHDFKIKVDIQLSMDANEASGPGSGVDRIMSNCNLVDAHSICTSDPSYPPLLSTW